MSDVNIRRLSDALLKGTIKAMGPFGLPAEIFLGTIDELIRTQKGDRTEDISLTIADIHAVVESEVRKQDARNAWAKVLPACMRYANLLSRADSPDGLSKTDMDDLDDLLREALGGNSSLSEGLLLIYNAQMSPSDMGTAQYAFPIYILGATIQVHLMILEVRKNALKNGRVAAHEWNIVREAVRGHFEAILQIQRYIQSYTIEKIMREEYAAGRFQLGSRELAARQAELEKIFLGGEGSATQILHSLTTLESRLREQEEPGILEESNKAIQEALLPQ